MLFHLYSLQNLLLWQLHHFEQIYNTTIAPSKQQPNINPSVPPISEPPSYSYSETTKQSTPEKASFQL